MASGYGQVSGSNPAEQGKNKMFVVAGSSIILVACVFAVTVSVSRHGADSSSGGGATLQTTSKSIQSICQPTDYKQECESSLVASGADNETDPKKLVQMIFDATIERVREGMNHSSLLQKAAEDPRTQKALEACNELLDYAVDDLRNSVEKFASMEMSRVGEAVDDLRVWLSAAITYQQTCLDGFENTTGDTAESMAKALNSSAALTSNTLAVVDEISSVLNSFQITPINRRLLSSEDEEFPAWVHGPKRRLLALSPEQIEPNVTVAKDGSGQFKTIAEAVAAAPDNSDQVFVIYVKEGVYQEYVQVDRKKMNLAMIGDGATKTKITGNLNFVDGTPTFKTATLGVVGDGFIMRDFGVENSAGAAKHQAVALRVQSDKSVFYRCQMDGYQDTLYAHTKRQFYRECTISGTIDFLFGDSPTIFQNCLLLVRRPLDNQQCICTAQGRKDRREATAIVLHNCTISADESLKAEQGKFLVYLGRPWKEYSRTLFVQSQIDDLIDPAGWMPWLGDFGLNTCFYAEVDNRGPGSDTAKRATWRGVKKIDLGHAQMFTVSHFIQGETWLPATGVPFTPGLL
ncbi:pectinesterase-like [Zingiber officinale]|uniref:Pectinesterase n=1 Tax=Zingiber officinale TaxID=94328 RepID=A0A8J5HRI1_ZINOF|nr:pectinesterase-like [Zingiber officinale]KAG6525699.1 hypothetical protein ZIOFF_015665 [Zingiber officinale]